MEIGKQLNGARDCAGSAPEKLKCLQDKLADNQQEISNLRDSTTGLEDRVALLNSKVQANIDLTDDIVATTSNMIATVESRVSQTLAHSDTVLASAHELIDFYLVVLTVIAGLAGILITYFLNRKQNEHLKKAAELIAYDINQDENFQTELVLAMLKNKRFRMDLLLSIERFAQDSIKSDISSEISDLKNSLNRDQKND
ncbi:MAG: hypothetical protein OIF51_17200 [Cellvibrionaceae bacterium]|nr:hypothetical protein [Cellvibrionaceae bacterium]